MCRILEDRLRFLLDWAISLLGKYAQDLLLVLRSKCFNRNHKFHSRITVDCYELVMLKLDYITVSFCNNRSYSYKFTWLIWKKYRNSEDSASLYKSLLNNR